VYSGGSLLSFSRDVLPPSSGHVPTYMASRLRRQNLHSHSRCFLRSHLQAEVGRFSCAVIATALFVCYYLSSFFSFYLFYLFHFFHSLIISSFFYLFILFLSLFLCIFLTLFHFVSFFVSSFHSLFLTLFFHESFLPFHLLNLYVRFSLSLSILTHCLSVLFFTSLPLLFCSYIYLYLVFLSHCLFLLCPI
jgi:hypothetical protein